jgi:tetratricopeptide (TPR) repeat protein
MYLKTPKRYQRGQKRSPISLRWLWLWILTPLVAFVGLQVYNNRDTFGPPVQQVIYNLWSSTGNSIATAMSPTLVPTQDPAERLARAEADWRDGRIEAALESYNAVIDAVPNNVQAHYRRTLGLLMEGSLTPALAAAEDTVTADPFNADAWAIRSMALDWNERYGEAIASALRALEISPDNARAMAFLAEAYKDSQQYDLAQSTIEKALNTDPNNFEALRVRGLIAQEIEFDLDAAKDYYQQAYNLAPNLPYLAMELAWAEYYAQNLDTAISMLNDIVETNPNNSRALFQMGFFYYNGQGNFSQAAEFLSRCVQVNPQSVNCQGLLGRVRISLEDYPGAVSSLQTAIELGSTNPRHFLWIGRAYKALGNCQEAVPYLQQGDKLAQTSGDAEAQSAIADNLSECQGGVPASSTATPTPEPNA